MINMSKWPRPQTMENAPEGKRILVWGPTLNGRWVGAKWNDDKYAKKPEPYWHLDDAHIAGMIAMRENPPTAWMELPPAMTRNTEC